ncbi:hypothetical protein CDAR_22001 [Caerostris darwini]|uniref:Uncharacterized protein n=1 Tax=Caerostris darwini TaxID=1538125 RepID=A0AAV4VW51_9ARAC|nr:hypothetical protein CDAR_22001 [Caerostris darwini]
MAIAELDKLRTEPLMLVYKKSIYGHLYEASFIFPPDLRINSVVLFCQQIELSKLLVDICILKSDMPF